MPTTRTLADDLRVPTRWPALDGVRGIAVIAVVLYHGVRLAVLGEGAPGAAGIRPLWWATGIARFALDAFFVLSGFLVVGSWTAIRRRHPNLVSAVGEYARRRLARILPAYWVSLVILIPLVAPHLLGSPTELGLLVTVQQYLLPGLPSEVNVVYWSLTTEVHFYVLAPIVAVLLARFGGWRVVALAFLVSVGWRVWLPGGLSQSLVLGRLEQFALGAATADLIRLHGLGHRSPLVDLLRRRGAGVGLWIALVALGVYQGALVEGVGTGVGAKLLHPAVALVLAGMFVRLLDRGRPSVLEHPTLRLFGLVSYGTYLFHYPLLEAGLRAVGADAASSPSGLRYVVAIVGLTAASLLIGAASYLVVERPFLRNRTEQAAAPAELDLRGQSPGAARGEFRSEGELTTVPR